MNIEPLALADFNLVEVKTTNQCMPTPHCKKHGAMNKITPDGIWRCITVSGFKWVSQGNSKGQQHVETICRAGCAEVKEAKIIDLKKATEQRMLDYVINNTKSF